jgi:S-adenosylmethionine:tRNA ribosyltransferase-isomerase
MHPKRLSIHDFSYFLPESRIARFPRDERDSSRLLVYKDQHISARVFNQVDELFEEGDLLVFNETRVIHARLMFEKESGSRIEIFCLEPYEPKETTQAFARKGSAEWICLVGNAKRWRTEVLQKEVNTGKTAFTLTAEKTGRTADAFRVKLSWNADMNFAEVIYHAGLLPLPPYMHREAEDADELRYQTVYARNEGSVAAPTAGLHFTADIFEKLKNKRVETGFITLHVGAGTFKPVKANTMEGHDMHEEQLYIPLALIEQIIGKAGRHRVIAVGTTSLRALESLYWFGVKLLAGEPCGEFFINQWEVYDNARIAASTYPVKEALEAVVSWMKANATPVLTGSTRIILAPPYRVRTADALITNFHQPESTLLLLVAAFVGPAWKDIYTYALQNDFRFLSYGDSSILFRT